MLNTLSPEFAALFPDYTRVVIVATDVDNHGEHPALVARLRAAEAAVRANAALRADPAAHPVLASWRAAFRRFGAKPADHRPGLESLVRRVLRGDELPYINTLVATMNAISLEALMPCGGDDLDKITGSFGLRLARGDEPFTPFLGGEVEHPAPGEVVLADDARVMCRRWTWRQGADTMLTDETRRVSINVDVLPPLTPADGHRAAEALGEILRTLTGAATRTVVLDKDHRTAEV